MGSAMQSIGGALTGTATEEDVNKNADKLIGPDRANYQNSYLPGLMNQTQGILGQGAAGGDQQIQAFNSVANMAAGNGPSLARANTQAALAQQNAALQSQAMSYAGSTGTGNTQRNLLNAQAANQGQAMQAGSQAAAAEQMGAVGQMAGAANALRSANLSERGQNLSGVGQMMGAANDQTRNMMQYDAGQQQLGQSRADIGMKATESGAKAAGGVFSTLGNIAGAAAMFSDEKKKTDVHDSAGGLGGFLKEFGQNYRTMTGAPPAPMAPAGPQHAFGPGAIDAAPPAGGLGQMSSPMFNTGAGGSASGVDRLASVLGNKLGGAIFSDEHAKYSEHDAPMHRFLNAIDPKSFRYKNPDQPGAMHGRVHGIMAQDAEKSSVGQQMVHNTPDGKMLDIPRAVSTSLASLAHLNDRINRLERMRKGARK